LRACYVRLRTFSGLRFNAHIVCGTHFTFAFRLRRFLFTFAFCAFHVAFCGCAQTRSTFSFCLATNVLFGINSSTFTRCAFVCVSGFLRLPRPAFSMFRCVAGRRGLHSATLSHAFCVLVRHDSLLRLVLSISFVYILPGFSRLPSALAPRSRLFVWTFSFAVTPHRSSFVWTRLRSVCCFAFDSGFIRVLSVYRFVCLFLSFTSPTTPLPRFAPLHFIHIPVSHQLRLSTVTRVHTVAFPTSPTRHHVSGYWLRCGCSHSRIHACRLPASLPVAFLLVDVPRLHFAVTRCFPFGCSHVYVPDFLPVTFSVCYLTVCAVRLPFSTHRISRVLVSFVTRVVHVLSRWDSLRALVRFTT